MARFIKDRKKNHGLSPGTLTFIGKQKMDAALVRCIHYNTESLDEAKIKNIDQVLKKVKEPGITWINIDGMHDVSLIETLCSSLQISPLIQEDIVNTDHRPRIWELDEHVGLIAKSLYWDSETKTVKSEQISFILGSDYLITFQERVGDHFELIRERLRNGKGKIRSKGADYLLYALLDALVDNYLLTVESIGTAIEALDEAITNPDKATLNQLYNYKKEIAFMRKTIRPMKEISLRLQKTESALISNDSAKFYDDLDELLTQAIEAIEIYYTMATDQLAIFNTNVNNRQNDVMKVLTIYASIFIPLTFIAGLYGTNFDFIPELHYKYSYFIMLGFMALISGIMLMYFRRKKWL
jgi:magnesium transporter